jgi:TRAP-type mannitol/chloroaromatic compound transport system substrate-binding protein
MASAFPGSALLLGTLGINFAENATAISGGSIKITFVEPHVLAAPFKLFDVVSRDKLEAAWATTAC